MTKSIDVPRISSLWLIQAANLIEIDHDQRGKLHQKFDTKSSSLIKLLWQIGLTLLQAANLSTTNVTQNLTTVHA